MLGLPPFLSPPCLGICKSAPLCLGPVCSLQSAGWASHLNRYQCWDCLDLAALDHEAGGKYMLSFLYLLTVSYVLLFNSEPINYHIFISIFTSYSVLIWLCKTWQSGYRLLQCGRGPGLHRCSVWSLEPRPVSWCTGCSRHSLSHLRNITCCSFQKRLDICTTHFESWEDRFL